MKYAFLMMTLMFGSSVMAQTMEQKVLSFIPEGKVLQEKDREFKIQTKQGSVVEVEFKANGEFEEASGKALDKDVFIPGEKILPLDRAVAALKKEAKVPSGEWNLEKTIIRGWVYEFEGHENGRQVEYVMDARSGSILDTRVDN
jgi:uncharacterized membrane protein YkoI